MIDLLKILIGSALYAVPMGLLLASSRQAPLPPQAPPVSKWLSPEPFPPGMETYETARQTQSIFVLSGRDTIDRAWISDLASKWQQSGGMEGLTGWRSDKFRLLPKRERYRIGDIGVLNSFGYTQQNRGILRSYPDGARFDDVLSNDKGVVFEHRSRIKRQGKWESLVLHKDAAARPTGYSGLKVTCNSCHNEAGTGGYAIGLVPGGDTVLSDPLDWSVWER